MTAGIVAEGLQLESWELRGTVDGMKHTLVEGAEVMRHEAWHLPQVRRLE